jgi:polyhydroxyalkanoate synthesis regulator phasin
MSTTVLEAERNVDVAPEGAPFEHPLMNELLEALKLPAEDKVPASWVPPKPTFLIDEELGVKHETEDEKPPDEDDEPSKGPATEPGTVIGSGEEMKVVFTSYGTSKQWTKNADRVMAKFCKMLNGTKSHEQYSVLIPHNLGEEERYSSDFIFMHDAIAEYMQTLESNMSPKAAAITAVFVVYIGHIGTGVMYRGRQLWSYGVAWWNERKEKKERDLREARARQERERFADMLVDAVKAGEITPEQAMQTMSGQINDDDTSVSESFEEEEDAIITDAYQDPDFEPTPVDAKAVTVDELRFRKSNGYCLLPECDKLRPPRNDSFCCAEHRSAWFKVATEANLPDIKSI